MLNFINRFSGKSFPYFLLVLIMLVGYLPVSFHLLALKNDIIQLDFPVKYFISKELHRGEFPVWMYNWNAGFPLGHLFTWSIYNPITFVMGILFQYDLHTLHVEFMFYILLGVVGIYKICCKVLHLGVSPSVLAATTYGLSGVTLTCSQFLAYMASIGILPWVFYFFVKVLQAPSLKNALCLAFVAFLLISWSYPAAAIICFYVLLALLAYSHFFLKLNCFKGGRLLFLLVSGAITFILCLPLIYMTIVTIPHFSRAEELVNNSNNFGYLTPSALVTVLFPFFGVNVNYVDTTFLFQNVHFGILGFGIAIVSLFTHSFSGIQRKVFLSLCISLPLILVISCGNDFFLKRLLDNTLPGFKWFRFPSFFRIFYLLSASLIVGFSAKAINEYCKKDMVATRRLRKGFVMLVGLAIIVSLFKLYLLNDSTISFFGGDRKNLLIKLITVGSLTWLFFLLIFFSIKRNALLFIRALIVFDLIIMALLSLPVYTVSSYSLKKLNGILFSGVSSSSEIRVSNDNAFIKDWQGNLFNSINVYSNKISVAEQYTGPLYLKAYTKLVQSKYAETLPANAIFLEVDSGSGNITMTNSSFNNHSFSAEVSLEQKGKVFLFQMWHPFWKVHIDKKAGVVHQSPEGLAYVVVPPGNHQITFSFYDKIFVLLTRIFFVSIITLVLLIVILTVRYRNV